MSDFDTQLKWEWPAGRAVETTVLVRVMRVSKSSKGLFGILGSPSLANALPDATDVVAVVDGGAKALGGKTILVQMPGVNALFAVGDEVELELIDHDKICVGIQLVDKTR